jgi:hypothetical protein
MTFLPHLLQAHQTTEVLEKCAHESPAFKNKPTPAGIGKLLVSVNLTG